MDWSRMRSWREKKFLFEGITFSAFFISCAIVWIYLITNRRWFEGSKKSARVSRTSPAKCLNLGRFSGDFSHRPKCKVLALNSQLNCLCASSSPSVLALFKFTLYGNCNVKQGNESLRRVQIDTERDSDANDNTIFDGNNFGRKKK